MFVDRQTDKREFICKFLATDKQSDIQRRNRTDRARQRRNAPGGFFQENTKCLSLVTNPCTYLRLC